MRAGNRYVTWREFEQHLAADETQKERVNAMDVQGTRGVGVVQVQVTELVKDFAELKASVQQWQGQHEQQHERELNQRVIGRRWAIGTAIAGLGLLVAMAAMVATLLIHTVP